MERVAKLFGHYQSHHQYREHARGIEVWEALLFSEYHVEYCITTTPCVYFSLTGLCVCISFHINPLGVPPAYIHLDLFRV